MTREEAIDILKNTIVRFGRTNGKTAYAEALQMAINALIAQPEETHEERTEMHVCDCVSRQAVIDALDKEYRCTDRSDDWDGLKTAMLIIENLPSAQSTMGQQNDGDTISRRMAIDAMANTLWHYPNECYRNLNEYEFAKSLAELGLKSVPAAQPEIIRCGQCKYAEVADLEDSQDGYTCQFHRGSIWFSGSYCSWAERREE